MLSFGQKKVLLTGGTGFLGSNILRLLLEKNYKVVVLKRSFSDTKRIDSFLGNSAVTLFDVDGGKLERCFSEHKIDCVIHTATAYGRTGESIMDIVRANFLFPLELLSLASKYNVELFVNTDTFSNDAIELPGKEEYYVKTKKDFLRYAKSIALDGGIKLVNMVMGQIYGPHDNITKFTPFIIKGLLGNVPEIRLTSGEQTRDFVFVEDAAQAFVSVLENKNNLERFEEFNIGTGRAKPLRSVVEMIKKQISSSTALLWGSLPYRKNEIMSHVANVRNNPKIVWTAGTSLEEGMAKTIEFYRHII